MRWLEFVGLDSVLPSLTTTLNEVSHVKVGATSDKALVKDVLIIINSEFSAPKTYFVIIKAIFKLPHICLSLSMAI
jgi:hypothetical protein